MPGDLELKGRNKHNLINGDFVMILAIVFGFLLTGGLYARTSQYPNQGFYETEIITPAGGQSQDGLQIETFGVQKCRSNTAINFLIDNSGSMQFGTKMAELKTALNTFAGQFPLSGAIALQTYSEQVKNRVEFSLFKDSKDKFIEEVNDMDWMTATHSKDAFTAAQNSINKGRALFPQYQFSLVFISDGIPETRLGNIACGGGSCDGTTCTGGTNPEYCMPHPLPQTPNDCRCYDTNQDPRQVAALMKVSGVRIFTIAFTDTLADAQLDGKLQTLMRELASSPEDYYHAPIETQLTGIISQITNRICTQ